MVASPPQPNLRFWLSPRDIWRKKKPKRRPRASGLGRVCVRLFSAAHETLYRTGRVDSRMSGLMQEFAIIWMGEQGDDGGDASVLTKVKPKTKRPPLYKVMLLNDDYTPMEFVVHVLERFFAMDHAQAFEIMLTVHKRGLAVVGVFSHEIAETKVTQVMDLARQHQHPLQCTMEKE